ncbi:magnesium chelatase, partial [Streptomyces sp. NPDC049577]
PEPLVRARHAARLIESTGTASVVVDCESGPVRLGLAGELGRALGGPVVTLDDLRADNVTALVRTVRNTHSRKAA